MFLHLVYAFRTISLDFKWLDVLNSFTSYACVTRECVRETPQAAILEVELSLCLFLAFHMFWNTVLKTWHILRDTS